MNFFFFQLRMTWSEHLKSYFPPTGGLFDEVFEGRWGSELWSPNTEDRKAAAQLYTQLVSRITTQRLGYGQGVEKTALDSVYALFDKTRAIVDANFGCLHFEAIAWHVLNTHVRPFTAKWHRASEAGLLAGLDTTDEFRAELASLQLILHSFEDVLLHLRDERKHASQTPRIANDREKKIEAEMSAPVAWGIPSVLGGIEPVTADTINSDEKKDIFDRREHYDALSDGTRRLKTNQYAIGLALSGGGIRSATFSLGVLVSLAQRDLLAQVDYLSTVSGGGYIGSFITAFLNSSGSKPVDPKASELPLSDEEDEARKLEDISKTSESIGLKGSQLPFNREEGESKALKHVRHHSKYLSTGSHWERIKMVGSQLFGMALNGLSILFLAAITVLVERSLREWPALHGLWHPVMTGTLLALAGWGIVSLALLRGPSSTQKIADRGIAFFGVVVSFLLVWKFLGWSHSGVHAVLTKSTNWTLLAIVGAIPVLGSAFAGVFGRFFRRPGILLVVLSAIAAPLFIFGVYLVIYDWASGDTPILESVSRWQFLLVLSIFLTFVYWRLLNINFTCPHRHYRNKLAEAYLIQPPEDTSPNGPFKQAGELQLSKIGEVKQRGPYQLLNCALNVPSSRNPALQGRLTDFFLFSRHFCGSPLTGYKKTTDWQDVDKHLDLGTAMAISGAAAAPQMGLATMKRLSFWLALLNVRLGYWVRNPAKKSAFIFGSAPGLWFLLKEMLGWMDENSPWLNVSDGGHIENLGVYELLRRRCKYIIAVDGEQDPRMTFHALTTLQRLAAIDFNIQLDINLDDLRLNEQGLSRSHFRFCRIRYPEGTYGYLLYVKLSLTGNEGEFIRRYRLDEPIFPHHSTADQFFSETQFEAYRTLGEHVGDKLFQRAIVGDLAKDKSIAIEDWFRELGKNFLNPLPE